MQVVLNSPGVNFATRCVFCRPFCVAFVRGEKKFSARFVTDAFIDHICRIKGPLKYLLRPLLGKNQFAVTQRTYACTGPNLDNVY